jgi:hypothetical protein
MQSKALTWTGRVLSALPVLLLLMSGSMAITQAPEVVDGLTKYHYPASVVLPIGVCEVVIAVLYAIPMSSVLGALLMTAYLGGAVATHVAASESPVAAIVVAVIAWTGLGLRDPRLRALLPVTRG